MDYALGILAAVIAMVSWGFGDFLIQKSTRRVGDWEALFYISIFGAIVILPFIYGQLPALVANAGELALLLMTSLVLLVAALFDFEALKEGKIAIAEPIFVIEIPVAALLAFFVISEGITLMQTALIGGLIVGLVLVSVRKIDFKRRKWLEKGVVLAFIGSLFMGTTNFLFGIAARETSALMVNWFTSLFLAVVCIAYLAHKSKLHKLALDGRKRLDLLLGLCILDNTAWIAFAYATVLLPIAIAVSISQCFIIITVLLGIFVSREKLLRHQKIGVVIAIVLAIALAAITG
jgi:drug/metabolite transporter (DMT)-like permease